MLSILRQLDDFDLLMVEQPLAWNDIYEHSKLQPQLRSDICLDESIHTVNDARLAIQLGACRIINLKPARVSGYTESLAVYRFCVEQQRALVDRRTARDRRGARGQPRFRRLAGRHLAERHLGHVALLRSGYYRAGLLSWSANSSITTPVGPGQRS